MLFDNPKTILYKIWEGDIDKDNIRNFMRDVFLMDNELWISGRYFDKNFKDTYYWKKRTYSHCLVDFQSKKIDKLNISYCYDCFYSPDIIIKYNNGNNGNCNFTKEDLSYSSILPLLIE